MMYVFKKALLECRSAATESTQYPAGVRSNMEDRKYSKLDSGRIQFEAAGKQER